MPPITPFDPQAFQQRLAKQRGQAYWRSVQELAEDPGFGEYLNQEFPRLGKVWSGPIDRRAFLKISAAAMAMGGLAACNRQPPEYIVPYVWMPEWMVPGKPLFYATTLSMTGPGVGVLVETHEGRPLRIRGNPAHPGSLGGLDVFNQAAILDLYDPDRTQSPLLNGEPAGYAQFQREWAERHAALGRQQGQGLHILTPELNSPSVVQQLQELLEALPRASWHVHALLAGAGARDGAIQAFGRALQTSHRLDRAKCTVALDADFLGDTPGSLRYARDYASSRSIHGGGQPGRLYVIESQVSITGAKADHRQGIKPAEIENFALALASRLGLPVPAPAGLPVPAYWLDALAQDLLAHSGESLVIAGGQQTGAVHVLTHAINARLGNASQTVDYFQAPLELPMSGLRDLQQAIAAGKVDQLVILGGNPAYDAPGDLDFRAALAKVPNTVYWGGADQRNRRPLPLGHSRGAPAGKLGRRRRLRWQHEPDAAGGAAHLRWHRTAALPGRVAP